MHRLEPSNSLAAVKNKKKVFSSKSLRVPLGNCSFMLHKGTPECPVTPEHTRDYFHMLFTLFTPGLVISKMWKIIDGFIIEYN